MRKIYYFDLLKTESLEDIVNEILNNPKILTPELLKGEWKYKNMESGINTLGHCYAASEALYYLTGEKNNWTPQSAKEENGETHWWLKNKKDGSITDPTYTQFTLGGKEPPYHLGKGCGFMQQSNRCIEIMKRVLSEMGYSQELKSKTPTPSRKRR